MIKINKIKFILTLLLALACTTVCFGVETEKLMSSLFTEGVRVDLREPTYCEGVLSTEQGGVIQGPGLRIQAMSIVYTRKKSEEGIIYNVVASGNLLIEYNDYMFIGEQLEYDFESKTGIITDGRTAMSPWFFGGEQIELLPDGTYRLYNGFITTSENYNSSWELYTEEAVIDEDQYLKARNIQLRLCDYPVAWLPLFCFNLNTITDSPFKYRIGWGGFQGPRIGVIYEMLLWDNFKAFPRLDYSIKRGFGGGLQTEYRSPDKKKYFETSNYVARDASTEDPDEKIRYRVEGLYANQFFDDQVSVDFSYDKLSDRQMETDYYDKGLELMTAQITELLVRQKYDDIWITNFLTRVRLNNFQSIKQELPSLEGSLHPITWGPTGIISDNQFKLSYLDFTYAKELIDVKGYNSTRFEFRNNNYRPFAIGPIINTPEVGFVGIYYGNSPSKDSKSFGLCTLGYTLNTQISKNHGWWKHAIEPYVSYNFYTFPSTPPNKHYIFDIEDGWFRLNKLRFGCRNLIYQRNLDCFITRYLMADIYADAFIKTPTIPNSIPYIYTSLIWDTTPTLRNTITQAWDTKRNGISYFNIRSDLTISEDLAIATEYRHRNSFSWRKVDRTNFILESFRPEPELRASSLSDRRDTMLVHLFYRFFPNWALEFESRYGWNRRKEPTYIEYEFDLLTTLASAWHLKISYQRKEDDHRVAFYFNLGIHPPRDRTCRYE